MNRFPARLMVALTALAVALTGLLAIAPAKATTSMTHMLWSFDDATKKEIQTQSKPIEVGTRFTSAVNGTVTGITFFKNSQDTGTHVGSLWTADGKRLAYLVFFDETPSGWQKASFDRPVAITANTEYVVSYHSPTGHHSYTYRYFRDRDVVSGPLRAARSAPGKVNGVSAWGPVGTFPQSNWEDLNYWVSPIFTTDATTSPSPTTTPPKTPTPTASPRPTTPAPTTPAPTTPVPTTPVPTTPVPATGHYQARGGKVYDPHGREFVSIGSNIGVNKSFDWKGTAYGHAKEAKEWGWNTVRVNVLATDAVDWSYVRANGYDAFMADLDRVITEYTGQGIVVTVASHDYLMSSEADHPRVLQQLDRFWGDMAKKYQGNGKVWFNIHNEPPAWDPQPWFDAHDRYLGRIRAAGAQNLVVVDAPTWGIDLGPNKDRPNVKFGYDPQMAPALAKKHGNVMLAMHSYAYEYGSPQALRDYVGKVRATGVPIIIGEFGWRLDGVKEWEYQDLNSVDANKSAAYAVFDLHKELGLSALWWHGTHGDTRALKDDYSAFWEHGSGNRLSEPGRRLWALTH